MKKVIYTVITGDNEYTLKEPKYITKDWDYICFTNRKNLKSDTWKVIFIDNDKLSDVKLSRKVKIRNDIYLNSYDLSIYIDSRFVIAINLDDFVNTNLLENTNIAVMNHNKRHCLYDEAEFLCLKWTKQIEKYKKENVPECLGLYAPGIMIRRHHKQEVIDFCKMWWKEVEKYSHRDIISFAYCVYKTNIKLLLMSFRYTYDLFMGRI